MGVFKTKRDVKDKIERYKTRFVVKGTKEKSLIVNKLFILSILKTPYCDGFGGSF